MKVGEGTRDNLQVRSHPEVLSKSLGKPSLVRLGKLQGKQLLHLKYGQWFLDGIMVSARQGENREIDRTVTSKYHSEPAMKST